MAGWEEEGYGGLSDTDVTAAEERGGGFEGQQNASYGDGGDMTRATYDPSQGPSAYERFMDTRRKNPIRDVMSYAAMATPFVNALAPAVGAYQMGMNAWGAIDDPAQYARNQVANTLGGFAGQGVNAFAQQAGPLGGMVSKAGRGLVNEAMSDIRTGNVAYKGAGNQGASSYGGGEGTQTQQGQVQFPNIMYGLMRW
jgi:hypothetical protein